MRELSERDIARILNPFMGFSPRLFCPGIQARGTTLNDRSGNALHGTITGATWTRTSGGILLLTGDGNDYVSFGTSSLLRFTSAFTLLVAVKLSSLTGEEDFLSSQEGGTKGFGLYKTTSSHLLTGIINGLTPSSLTDATALSVNTMYFCGLTYTGTKVGLYKNGAAVSGPTSVTGTPVASTVGLFMGRYANSNANRVVGNIGFAVVIPSSLSSAQHAALYSRIRPFLGK